MSEKPVLSGREMQLLTFALQSCKDPNGFQVDYKKFMELSGLKSVGSASASWGVIKKKLIPTSDATATDGDGVASAQATPLKAKTPAKKRGPAKPKAKAGAEVEADGDNGVAADDEQTPVNTPKRKGGAKRKAPEPSSPIKAEDESIENAAAHGEDVAAEEAPAKKKRVRKPKDPNAPPPKPRVKKETKAASTSTVADDDDNIDAANTQMLDDAEGEVEAGGGHASMFGDGNIKVEGDNELDAEEMEFVHEAFA